MDAEKAGLILTRAAIQTLEDVAFLFSEPVQDVPRWGEELIEARLDFKGGAEGHLRLMAGRGFADRLAASLLGLEPGEDPEVDACGDDALGEVLNIIAGTALSAWYGPRCVCEIGAPKVAAVTAAEQARWADEATCAAVVLTDEDDPIAVSAALAGGCPALRGRA